MFAFLLCLCLSDTDCDLCTLAAQQIEDAIKQGFSDDMIRQAVEAACPSLPAPYSDACKQFVATMDKVLKDLHAGKSPHDTCVDCGYCANVLRSVLRNDVTCHMSEQMVKRARKLAKRNATSAETVTMLAHKCQIFKGAMKEECQRMAATAIPFAYVEILKGSSNRDVAERLGYCARKPALGKTGGWISCEVCKQAVSFVERQLEKGTVVEHITGLLQEYCKQELSGSLLELCNQLAKDYVPVICKWIDEQMHAYDICGKLGYCSVRPTEKKRPVPSNDVCQTCKQIVKYVEDLLKSGTVESEIVALVSKMCQQTPVPSICESIVQQYVPVVIELIAQGIETLDICVNIGLCATPKARPVARRA